MKAPLVVAVWTLTVAAAFLVGRGLGERAAGDAAPSAPSTHDAELERRVLELTQTLNEERSRRPRVAVTRDARDAAPLRAASDDPSPAASGGTAEFSLEGLSGGPETSRRLMSFVEAQLGRGPDGCAPILRALNTLWRDEKTVERMFGDETTTTRELYPWVKTLVHHEGPVLDLTEYVFRTMAEKPEAFADTPDDAVLEIFTEAVGMLLPGAVPEERLARFRAYAQQIIATPEAKQPVALRNNRSNILRLLTRYWLPPTTAEEAVQRLKAGGVSPADTVRLLRVVPDKSLGELDFDAIVESCLRAGDSGALEVIARATAGRLDLARLDRAIIQATDADKTNGWLITSYFEATGRKQWSELRPFFDHVLALGDAARTTAFDTLARYLLPPGMCPDKAYVEGLLSRGNVPDEAAEPLRDRYGIK